nr:hypothetical protein CFP56_28768 [Quercus suber]
MYGREHVSVPFSYVCPPPTKTTAVRSSAGSRRSIITLRPALSRVYGRISMCAPSIPRILLTIPHAFPHALAELLAVLAPQLAGLDVRGAFVVGAAEHADDGEQDGLGGLHGRPALRGGLVAVLVVFGRVQDTDADDAGFVDWRVGVVSGGCGWWCGRERAGICVCVLTVGVEDRRDEL